MLRSRPMYTAAESLLPPISDKLLPCTKYRSGIFLKIRNNFFPLKNLLLVPQSKLDLFILEI